MDASALLTKLATLGVTVSVDGEDLRLEPGSRVPAELLPELRAKKPQLLAALSSQQEPDSLQLPDGWQDAIDIWVAVGCPKDDPIMLGLQLTALRSLTQLPREQRLPVLRRWQQQVRQHKQQAGR